MSGTREAWLMRAADALREQLFPPERQPPRVWISVGFPKGHRGRGRAIGQCWDGALSGDGAPHIFIHPALVDPVAVLAVLAHELVHATVGCEAKHRGPFPELCKRIGLVKPWTATSPDEPTLLALTALSRDLGPFEHSALTPPTVTREKSRQRVWKCACGIPIRAAHDALTLRCETCGQLLARQGVKDA
jgi:hypothetical protein